METHSTGNKKTIEIAAQQEQQMAEYCVHPTPVADIERAILYQDGVKIQIEYLCADQNPV